MDNFLSLIIPVYRNEGSLPELIHVLENLNKELNGQLEVVLVVDGSPDRSYEVFQSLLPTTSFSSKLILLTRNFGSFSAIRAGLEAGQGDRFAVMAADLQEPPELITQMNAALILEDVDVIIAERNGRCDPFLTRLFSKIFWSTYRYFVIPEIPSGGVDVFGCNRIFRDQLLKLEERHTSLVAQIFWMGYRRKFISYVRQERKWGKSAWTFKKKISYLMDSIFSFTDLPIRLLMYVGAGGALFSGGFGLIVAISRLFGFIVVPGYAATVLAIVFFGALNLFALGIVGSYAWRTYENTKARPHHIVLHIHEFKQERRTHDLSPSRA